MNENEIRDTLRSYILNNFLPGEPPETLEDSTLLITSGVITSLSMAELVTFIEDTFDVALDEDDIGSERMDSVELMVTLVSEKLDQKTAAVG